MGPTTENLPDREAPEEKAPGGPRVGPPPPGVDGLPEVRQVEALRRRVLILFSLPAGLLLAVCFLAAFTAIFNESHEPLARPVNMLRLVCEALALEIPSLLAGAVAIARLDVWTRRGWLAPSLGLGSAWALCLAGSLSVAYLAVERFLYLRYTLPYLRESGGFLPPSYEGLPNALPSMTLAEFLSLAGMLAVVCLPTAMAGCRLIHRTRPGP